MEALYSGVAQQIFLHLLGHRCLECILAWGQQTWVLVLALLLTGHLVVFSFFREVFIYGCAGSSLLHTVFLQFQWAGANLQLPRAGFSLQWLLLLRSTDSRYTDLAALWHVESSWTRAQTRVPCIGRWILNLNRQRSPVTWLSGCTGAVGARPARPELTRSSTLSFRKVLGCQTEWCACSQNMRCPETTEKR